MDDKILDMVIPIPDEEAVTEEIFEELEEQNFTINNTRSGGIFYTLIRIFVKIHIELKELAREVLKNMYLESATDSWVELKAADFGKQRKLEVKCEGYVTVMRSAVGEAVKINKGTVFKTPIDSNGDELKYIAIETVVLPMEALSAKVKVEAELPGSRYNVAQGQITRCLVHINGIEIITNNADWIIKEGADIEDIESLKTRTLLSWAELATLPIRDKYKNTCEAVDGVLKVEVEDNHPRGQGTVDIYVTSPAGTATEALLGLVRAAADSVKGPYDNLLIQSTAVVLQDITVRVDIPDTLSLLGVKEIVEDVIKELLSIRPRKRLNTLYHTDIIYEVKKRIPKARAVDITLPAEDISLTKNKILMLGVLKVEVRTVS